MGGHGGLKTGSERADEAAVPWRWPGAHTMGEAGRTGSAPAEPRMRGAGSEEWRQLWVGGSVFWGRQDLRWGPGGLGEHPEQRCV